MTRSARALLAAGVLAALAPAPGRAAAVQLPELAPPPPAASGAAGAIDPEAATRAYLDQLPPDRKARSDAYFEGGYWLDLWEFLWGAAVYLLLLGTGLSARMRDRAERLARFRPIQVAIYWTQFLVATALLGFPLAAYRGYFREHRYGLSNLSFGGWLGEQAKGFLLGLVFGALAMMALYAVVRRAPRTWWIWGTGVVILLTSLSAILTPVLLVPIFNTPKRLEDARVTGPILSLARANGIPAKEVWQVDASRQSKRISANVSGFLGTERLTLNDNLLARASLPEIEAVMAHEMGHYVLNHLFLGILEGSLLTGIGFAAVAWAFERLRRRFEGRWRVRDVADPAGLPLAALLYSTYALLASPVFNSVTRSAEVEADMYGLNAARQPDGFAQVSLKLSEYRKLEPGRLEEIVFFDHPSGRTRIFSAMRWKAEHPETWGAASGAGAEAPPSAAAAPAGR
jgi:Zn-dependent protease with chaperone function